MNQKIIGTGLSGLVGTRVCDLLSDQYEFYDLSYSSGIDITDLDQVLKQVENIDSNYIIHMAAKTDVDGCEDDKILLEEGQAWQINVQGTENIIEAAKRFKKHIIYISTDFVFDGSKDTYTEEDEPNPVNWYARTKWEAEQLLIKSDLSFSIARLSYPFRAYFPQRVDFVRRIIDKIKKKEKILALSDHIFTPTFIDDIAQGLDLLLKSKATGIYHLVGSESLRPIDAIHKIEEAFNLQANISEVTRDEYFKGKAFRPFHLALRNDKIAKLGFKMHTFSHGLGLMSHQLATRSY